MLDAGAGVEHVVDSDIGGTFLLTLLQLEQAKPAHRCEYPTPRPLEVVSEPEPNGVLSYASRSATKQYRTTPLRALLLHPPYFHNGVAAMHPEIVSVDARELLSKAGAVMVAKRLRSVPVVERRDGSVLLVGILSRGDVLRGFRFQLVEGSQGAVR